VYRASARVGKKKFWRIIGGKENGVLNFCHHRRIFILENSFLYLILATPPLYISFGILACFEHTKKKDNQILKLHSLYPSNEKGEREGKKA
jgi:hypothetical protein